MSARVAVIAFLFAFLGVSAEVLNYLNLTFDPVQDVALWVRRFLSSVNLGYSDVKFLSLGYRYNFLMEKIHIGINILFYALLITGAIGYVFSRGRQTRLIQFVIATVFISNCVYAVNLIPRILFPDDYHTAIMSGPVLPWIFLFGKCIVFALGAYYILNTIRKAKTGQTKEPAIGDEPVAAFIRASTSKRFVHYMLDTFVCVLAVSPSIPAAVSRFILDIPVLSQPPFPLLLGFVLLRMVYYPFFEIILRATPAKFLTGSYVVTTEGRKAGVPTIIKRTFARSIPFNAFSFLGSGRWHDRLSGTQVVSDVK